MHELTFSIVLCIIIVFTIRLFLCLINIVRAWNYIFWVDGKWRNERRKKLRDEQNQMMHKYYADYNNRGNEISKFFSLLIIYSLDQVQLKDVRKVYVKISLKVSITFTSSFQFSQFIDRIIIFHQSTMPYLSTCVRINDYST